MKKPPLELIKPCPFCGYAEVTSNLLIDDSGCNTAGQVKCPKCKAEIVTDNKRMAILAWNRRNG